MLKEKLNTKARLPLFYILYQTQNKFSGEMQNTYAKEDKSEIDT